MLPSYPLATLWSAERRRGDSTTTIDTRGHVVRCRAGYRPGIDVRGDGGYVLGVGSALDGIPYTWATDTRIAQLSINVEQIQNIRLERLIPEGQRNTELVSLAGMLVNAGCSQQEIYWVLRIRNHTYYHPPLPDHEILQLSKSAARNFEPHPEMLENVIVDTRRVKNP